MLWFLPATATDYFTDVVRSCTTTEARIFTAKALNIYREIANHDFQHVNAGEIVARIMKGRAMYEERQRLKGEKGLTEEAEKERQERERDAERERRRREVEMQFGL